MAYYENQQWPPAGQAAGGWDHQTPPPARSGSFYLSLSKYLPMPLTVLLADHI